jgi:cation diffusion facilitator family transporter
VARIHATRLTLYAAFVANLAIAIIKFVAAALGGSSALFSEGMHSVVDTGDGLLILLGVYLSHRPPTERHPYGHGIEVYFWTIVVAMSIFGLGGGLSIYRGISRLSEPHVPRDLAWTYGVLAVSFVFEGCSWLIARRQFRHVRGKRSAWDEIRRSKDPTTFVVVLEDSAALLGIGIAVAGLTLAYALDAPVFDALASIVIGCLLLVVGIVLGRETRSLLLGESAARAVVESIRQIACAVPGVVDAQPPRTMHVGPAVIHVDLDIELAADARADAVATARRIEAAVQAKHPKVAGVFVRFGSE